MFRIPICCFRRTKVLAMVILGTGIALIAINVILDPLEVFEPYNPRTGRDTRLLPFHDQAREISIQEERRVMTSQRTPPPSTSRPMNSSSLSMSKRLSKTKDRLLSRIKHIRDVCKRSNYSTIPSVQEWRTLSSNRLQFCSIPKSGSTFLSDYLNKTIRTMGGDNEQFPINQYKRFMFVREPYSRLVSAYFSKVVGHPMWWSVLANIVYRTPGQAGTSRHNEKCRHDVSFHEYVKFILNLHRTGTNLKEPHFARIMNVCNVCADIPDFVGKLEDFGEDMAYILSSVNLTARTEEKFIEIKHIARLFVHMFDKMFKRGDCGPMCAVFDRFWWSQQGIGLISLDIRFPINDSKSCNELTKKNLISLVWEAYQNSTGRIDRGEQRMRVMVDLFRQVPLGDRRELQKMFRPEFELFGYEAQPEFVFPELFADQS